MKKSKQANASDLKDGVDRISNLPDPILHLILSRLEGTEEVIRTSILSTRWRYLWTLIPSIDIDCSRGLEFERNKFKKFVEHVLASDSLDLDKVRLSCSNHYNMSTIGQWIQAAVNRNIKQLHLLFCCGNSCENIELPHCLVTCGSLEVLRLSLSVQGRITFPKVTGFLALRVLELNKLELCFLKEILERIPLLEELSLIDCEIKQLKILCISCPKLKNLRLDNHSIFTFEEFYYEDCLMCGCIEIVCPKLVSFEFGAFVAEKYIFNSLDSLKTAVIHPQDYPCVFMDYPLWFASVSHLEYLSTSIDILGYSLWPSDSPLSLPNLKTLKLTTGTYDINNISRIIEFITCHPHLEFLHLIIKEKIFCWRDRRLVTAEGLSILTRHLKKVEFLNFYKQKLLVDTTRYLLEHSNALEEMVFRWDCDEAKFHERSMETMKEVSNFQKASSTVKLITLNEIS